MEVFIKGAGIISPQKTTDNNVFLNEIVTHERDLLKSVEPVYKDYINPIQLRRMSRLIKMSITASKICLKEAGIDNPGAIISGTGLGLVEDTEKFLNSVLDYKEQFLTPTSFIQSTHNTISGQVAIALQCFNYNNTYSHRGFSFESALLDAMLLINDKDAENALVGGFDEITEEHHGILKKTKWVKKEQISHLDLLNSKTPGTYDGEGVSFFSLTGKRESGIYAQIKNISTLYKPKDYTEIESHIEKFLSENRVSKNDLDLVVLGLNGDVETDGIYYHLAQHYFNTNYAYFKHLVGDYHTVGAFALWFGAKCIKHQNVPEVAIYNKANFIKKPIKNVLVYNHFKNINHSFYLLNQ